MVGLEKCIYTVQWNGRSSRAQTMKQISCAQSKNNFNNAKTDPTGRLYVGTYNKRICNRKDPFDSALYSYDKHQGLQEQVSGLKVSNGLAWCENTVYHIESCFYNIRQFDWNSRTGELCRHQIIMKTEIHSNCIHSIENSLIYFIFCLFPANPRVVYKFDDVHGNVLPIGMAINNEGHLYCAKYRQGRIDVICPK